MRRRSVAALAALGAFALAQPAAGGPLPPADTTPPEIEVTVSGPQGEGGWYVGPVVVEWTVTDAESATPVVIDEGCEPSVEIDFDTPGLERVCRATSEGGTAEESVTIRRDATAPATTATASRGPDRAGWYTAPVGLGWIGSDGTSGVASCTSTTYGGPDTPGTTVQGTCRDRAGNTSPLVGYGLRYDATAPVVTGVMPARPIPASGWFASPVDLVWLGADATSGVEACTTVRGFAGAGRPTGSCRDSAGNSSAPVAAPALRIDSAPPELTRVVAARVGVGARITWRATGASTVRVTREPGLNGAARSVLYTGRGSRVVDRKARRTSSYRYVVQATDPAGHETTGAAQLRRANWLLAPEHGLAVDGPPELRWRRVKGANFYNVQLFRGKEKILTAFPRRTRLELEDEWEYAGKTRELEPGIYRWYVWASHHTRAKPRYGRMLGGRAFVVR